MFAVSVTLFVITTILSFGEFVNTKNELFLIFYFKILSFGIFRVSD